MSKVVCTANSYNYLSLFKKSISCLVIISVSVFSASCANNVEQLKSSELQGNAARTDAIIEGSYRIGVDDTVQVSVWRNPELSITVPVRPDGKISVPLIGDVQAGGLTPEQVSKDIQRRLAAFIRDPQVAVILTALRSHEYLTRVRVTGAVATPSSLPHRQGMTILDAVLASGGLSDFAAPGRAKLYRSVDGKTKSIEIDLDEIINKGNLEKNYILRPGDVITVPERIF